MKKTEIIAIHVGAGLNCAQLTEALRQARQELFPVAQRDLQSIDIRATIRDEVEVEMVRHLRGRCYRLHYSFDWSAYFGCDDLTSGGTELGHLDFKYNGTQVRFALPDADGRSTRNEL